MNLDCEGWRSMLDIFPEMDFTEELNENPELAQYLIESINKHSTGLMNPLDTAECPKLNEDFSNYIILNGLPKCDEAKSKKLVALLIKLFGKLKFVVEEDKIEMCWDDSGEKTTGTVICQLKNEE